jgi:hypothetical protein
MSTFVFLKRFAIAAFGAFCFSIGIHSQTASPKTGEVLSSSQFNWDNRGVASLSIEKDPISIGDADFNRIRIRVAGQKDFVITNTHGWIKLKSAGLSSRLISAQVVGSEYVLAVKASKERTLLFLFGYAYASAPGSLDILALSQDGRPEVVFHRKEFGLSEVLDLDGDGLTEVVGYPCLSQEWGNGLETYDPFNVYKFRLSPSAQATLSLPLTKSYNLKHYYGWAGPTCSEEFAVVLHPPKGGKPIVLPANEAEKMTAGK